MCELFGMASRYPAVVRYSLEEFSRHGGLAGPHKDGWGVAYYVDGDVRLLKETEPASDSACVRFIQEHPFASRIVVSHIRKATQGRPALANCQPFARELGGAMHVFAHNGDLDRAALRDGMPLACHRPVGETDSEQAFCALLARLQPLWAQGMPPFAQRLAAVAGFARELRELGPANFLYSDGDALFAHGHRRTQPGGGIAPPGLHLLTRRCAQPGGSFEAAGLAIASSPAEQRVALFASVALTAEPGWRALAEGEIVAVRDGAPVLQPAGRREEALTHDPGR